MEIDKNTLERILILLLRESFEIHTITSIANTLNKTRPGIWKAILKLSNKGLIDVKSINKAKTSATLIKLNYSNPITEKTLSLILTEESLRQQRWRINFKDFEDKVHFLILFGSMLNKPKEAEDIDILVISDKKNFKVIEETTLKIQKNQLKKIHLIDLTIDEFKNELKTSNKAYLNAIKEGAVLYGQEKFVQFMKELQI